MRTRPGWIVHLWLAGLSASTALALTVVLLDRASPTTVSRQWLAFLAASFLVVWGWWERPTIAGHRAAHPCYRLPSLALVTSPLALASLLLVGAGYLFEELHYFLFTYFYLPHLLSDRAWPAGLLGVLLLGCCLTWIAREVALRHGDGLGLGESIGLTLPKLPSLLPPGMVSIGLLLATASVAMMSLNFWRYWVTADGWLSTGHYVTTIMGAVHVEQAGVAKYFISFPLLPALLTATYHLLGHNTLASHLPLILGSALLPLALFLTTREVVRNSLLAFLFAMLGASFPLLRSYTLDMPEADGLLMTSVLFAAYFRLRADRLGSKVGGQVAAGVAAGVAALARPEGVLYMGALYLTSLKDRWRDGGYWLSALVFGLIAACFSAVTLHEFGMIWPGNHSATIHPSNFFATLEVVQENHLFRMYAAALGIDEMSPGIWAGVALLAVLASSLVMLRKRFSLIYMPLTALGNIVMVFFVGPIPAEAAKFHDFFRHISYGFPLLAVTLAFGTAELFGWARGRWGRVLQACVVLGVAGLVLAQLYLLAGPVTPGRSNTSPIMTSDVHVTAQALVASPYPLPVMRFRESEGYLVPDEAQYMLGFPVDIVDHYASHDVREAAIDSVVYYWLAMALFVAYLALAVLARVPLLGRKHARQLQKL